LERAARKKVKDEAISEGLDEESEEVRIRMENARQSVLDDSTLFDAPLSEVGKEEALRACEKIKEIVLTERLTFPTEVLVSPLTRALQSADLIFPEHKNIRVRELLRERKSGKACDDRSPSHELARSFSRFSMNQLRIESMSKLDLPHFEELFGFMMKNPINKSGSDFYGEDANIEDIQGDTLDEGDKEEDLMMLRDRTKKLFDLLAASEHEFVGVVSHKGYLRELERSTFSQSNVKEFENCQIKVYKVRFTQSNKVVEVIKQIV
jgi:bisphosphoglycerate-dependent phosphoglycerate mutase